MSTLATAIVVAISSPSFAADPKTLEMFGVKLNGATRDQMRQVLKRQGLRVIDEDKNSRSDTYSAATVLEGATELALGYVEANTFAIAQYTFPSFMDTQQVERVISMITAKYGRPTSVRGSFGLGPVTASWKLGPNAEIEVAREWPNTTTYLRLFDPVAGSQMLREAEAARKAQTEQKAKAQSKAF